MQPVYYEDEQITTGQLGMTLRDYFAAAMLRAYTSNGTSQPYIEEQARIAYMYADAMLKERAK
jgi:hypothetical protein